MRLVAIGVLAPPDRRRPARTRRPRRARGALPGAEPPCRPERARRSCSRPATAPSCTSPARTPRSSPRSGRTRALRARRRRSARARALALPAHRRDRVAASEPRGRGLDSLVPGEAQVLGQVRSALALADAEGTAGPCALSRLPAGARDGQARAQRDRRSRPGNASVASVAASLADGALGGLAGRSALVVGAGRTSELAALNLMSRGLRRLSVANRTYQSACVLAGRLGGSAVHFEDVAEQLREVDVVVSSTAAPHAVLRTDMVAPARRRAAHAPLVVLDLAVPSDVEPEVAELEGCRVHTPRRSRDSRSRRTVALRRDEAAAAEAICADAAEEFRAWQAERTVVPAIGRLHARAEALRAAEVERLVGRTRSLPSATASSGLSRGLVGKLLHSPTTRLRRAQQVDGVQYAETALDLFGLAGRPRVAGAPSRDARVAPRALPGRARCRTRCARRTRPRGDRAALDGRRPRSAAQLLRARGRGVFSSELEEALRPADRRRRPLGEGPDDR